MQKKNRKRRDAVLKLIWTVTGIAALVVFVIYYSRLYGNNEHNITVSASEKTERLHQVEDSHISKETVYGAEETGGNEEDIIVQTSGKRKESEKKTGGKAGDITAVPGGDDSDTDVLHGDDDSDVSKPLSGEDSETGDAYGDDDSDVSKPLNGEGSEAGNTSGDEAVVPDDVPGASKSGRIDPQKKMVALTFDDGPSNNVTGRILDVLEAYDARATFFMVGYNIKEHRELVERVYDAGCQIGNHTLGHKDITKNKDSVIEEEVEGNNRLLNEIVPVGDVVLRPPYGSYNKHLRDIIKVPMICWSVDSLDWKSRNRAAVVKSVMENVKDGYIVLMHDLYESTAEAVEELVPKLIEEGYQLVTVNELFEARGEALEPGHVYRYTKSAEEYISEKNSED